MRLRIALSLLVALVLTPEALAQWQSFPAFRDIRALAGSDDAVWAATPAGVFSYAPADGSFSRYTTIDGLRGGEVTAIAVAPDGRVWVGYADGVLDRIDPVTDEVRSFFEIARADQYASRGVNRIRPRGEQLFIATDFGLVVWDTARDEVRQTAARLGPLESATPVRDAALAPAPDGSGRALWLATDEGLVWTPEATDNLQLPSAWTLAEGSPAPAYALAEYDGALWTTGRLDGLQRGDLYKLRTDGIWERLLFTDAVLPTLVVADNRLAVVEGDGGRTYVFETGVGLQALDTRPLAFRLRDITLGPDGRLWAADAGEGLYAYPEIVSGTGTVTVTPDPRLPAGPIANAIEETDLGAGGVVWAASGALAIGTAGTAAVSRLEDGVWASFRNDESAAPDRGLRTVVARPGGGAFVGSEGGGLFLLDASGAVEAVFDDSNSTLRPAVGTTNFIVVEDVVQEGDGWWVLNPSSPRPLHFFPGTPEATPADWAGLPPPPGGPTSINGEEIAIDGFGQKWIALKERGLMVWDTGADPRSPADDRGRGFSVGSQFQGQGLPNGDVRAVVRDREGRIWIGTARGIAVVFSPGSAFGGDAALAEPTWPLFEGGGATDYLLRDVSVNAMAVDPAGRLWVGTTSGAFLLTPEADQIALRLDAENSPLASSDIVDVDVDARTGLVYLTTAEGLYAYQGDATGPNAASEALTFSHNPFRPGQTGSVTVGGLSAQASRVRVLTVDGMTVYQSDATFGGSFQWDGRDERTGELVPSGVYLVAASGANGEGTVVGKLAVLR